ncbi:MAG: hypothetical protein Q9201_002437 [Fulgogasparrea decipioides]
MAEDNGGTDVKGGEVIAAALNKALEKDGVEFWTEFEKQLMRNREKTVEEFRQIMQANDDKERKEKGLQPRPWTEIEKEKEEESDRFLEYFDEEVHKWDVEWRKSQGLEPRSTEELENNFDVPDLSECGDLLKAIVINFDTQKRKENGLGPRSWDEFEESLRDVIAAVDEEIHDDDDEHAADESAKKSSSEASAPPNMASLSLGNASGLR